MQQSLTQRIGQHSRSFEPISRPGRRVFAGTLNYNSLVASDDTIAFFNIGARHDVILLKQQTARRKRFCYRRLR